MDGTLSLEVRACHMQLKVVDCARNRVDVTRYEFYTERVRLTETSNCYTFVWWVMDLCCVSFPQLFLDQVVTGNRIVGRNNWQPADVIFTKGLNGQIYGCGAGHVGILTGETVIHACSRQRFVVEDPLDSFLFAHELVMVRRVIMSCL